MASGNDLLTIAAPHVGDEYILGALAPKNNSNWHGPWDCAEFVSWCVFQAGAILYGCNSDNANPASADAYTGYWARDADSLGRKISVEEAARTPGAAMLRIPRASANGHIVLCDGTGGTIEAMSHSLGVRKSTLNNRRWDMGILIPGITYEANGGGIPINTPTIFRLTSPFMKGEKVRKIQVALAGKGVDPGPIDGIFGPKTEAAVLGFQLAKGLVPDGEVGPETAGALEIQL
jgi:putative peptidoglycan binding protein